MMLFWTPPCWCFFVVFLILITERPHTATFKSVNKQGATYEHIQYNNLESGTQNKMKLRTVEPQVKIDSFVYNKVCIPLMEPVHNEDWVVDTIPNNQSIKEVTLYRSTYLVKPRGAYQCNYITIWPGQRCMFKVGAQVKHKGYRVTRWSSHHALYPKWNRRGYLSITTR